MHQLIEAFPLVVESKKIIILVLILILILICGG